MGSSVHHGYGSFSHGDKPSDDKHGNRTHVFNSGHVFECFVRTGRWASYTQFGARMLFRRHSALRPYIQDTRHRGAYFDYDSNYTRSWEDAIDYTGGIGSGLDGQAGSSLTARSDTFGNMSRTFGRNYQLGNYSMGIGSYVIDWTNTTGSQLATAANSPTGGWGSQALSEVDLPNSIGNVFKHPHTGAGGSWFNLVGNVALSQGQISITGIYNPPETRLMHAGYQVYYAKSGGTGTVVGAVKTAGETFPGGTSAARFRDTTFAGFVIGDVGKYIAIHGQGIYLITNFVDGSNVDVDSVTINESFVNATGLTWTLRTGPIGEYFFRRRPYFKLQDWVNYGHFAYSTYSLMAMDELLQPDKTGFSAIPQRVVYDGYGHWWWTAPNRPAAYKQYGLLRHTHMSPQPWQAPVFDGSLTGLTSWGALTIGGWWEDIIVDVNKKLWVSSYSPTTSDNVLARINPAPGGNAAAPSVELMKKKQTNAADAAGLTSSDMIAMCDDRSNAYSSTEALGPGSHRIWTIGGAAEAGTPGGLNYSDDNGTTWKRVHQLSAATGTVTATNGSVAVTLGVGTLFTTQFAVGDWIRFGSDTRSYLIVAIAGASNLTLGEPYLGTTGAGKTLQKGALSSTEAVLRTGYTVANNTSEFSNGQHNIDWDTNGNVYWISSSGRICRWKQSDGACVSWVQTAIPAVAPLLAFDGTSHAVGFLKVIRVPNVAGAGVHPFHNEVWLGTDYISSGDTTRGGWVRVRGDVAWTSTPTAANFTRYHVNNTIVTSFPSIVRVPKDGTSDYQPRNTSIIVEPKTGNALLFSSFGGEGTPTWSWLRMSGTESGQEYWQATQNMLYTPQRAAAPMEPWRRAAFDEEGMGFGCVVSGADANEFRPTSEPPMAYNATVWIDRRWNGSAWVEGMLCGSTHFDLNLRGGSNIRTRSAVLGAGFRRVHEWVKPLEDDMYIAFLQAGGAVAQTDEFMADETSTFVCVAGGLKDNTQTCNVYYQFFVQPTVYRAADESIKALRNSNTVNGGADGGFQLTNNGSLTFMPPFSRGMALHHKHPNSYGTSAGFLTTQPFPVNAGTGPQATICLRIDDQLELDNDGFWSIGTDLFNTTGGYVFTGADVGKSIFVEGANGATVDVDNGQAVILAVNSPTQVQVDKTFAATRTIGVGRRWKLRDIPAVAFMEAGFYNTANTDVKLGCRHDLWSSKDHGQNWGLVKYSGEGTNSIPLGGPDDVSPGVWYSGFNGYKSQPASGDANNVNGNSIIFDLRGLPHNVRRRQYWRWRMFDPNNLEQPSTWFADVFLYDDSFRMIGRPAASKVDDADDDLFFGCQVDKLQDIRKTGTGASPIDDGNADGLTNIVNVTGPLYLDTGVNDAQVVNTGRFIDAGAAFTRLIVGNFIRISGAANAANNGWALITGFVSATEVQTSKGFVNETNTFTWATCSFGPNDELRIESAVVLSNRSVALDDTYYVITDVPSTSQITVQTADVPHPITAAAWEVGRNFNQLSSSHPSAFTLFDASNAAAYGHIEGTLVFGYDNEFVVVQTGTLATTPADGDGDGRTDEIIVAQAITSLQGPAAGDMIEVSHVTYGTRMFEIVNVTGTDPNKVVKVKYDELPVSLSSITWRILRRRDIQYRVQRVTVVGRGAPVT